MCIALLILALKVGGFETCLLTGELKVDAFENAFLTEPILTLFNLLLLKEITESQLKGVKKIPRRRS
jgi:hypothetical protein